MAVLEWYKYPTDVKQSVRTIPVQVTLQAGVLPANLQLVALQTSPSISIYTENGAVVSKAVAAPAPANTFEVYLSVSTIDDHDIWVLNQINPEAKQSIAVTLRDSVTGGLSVTIYIRVAPIDASSITSERSVFSDDFTPGGVSRDNWTMSRTVGGASAGPNQTTGPVPPDPTYSHLVLNNPAGLAAASASVMRSDIIEGKCHVEFRGTLEALARNANSAFAFGVYFVDFASVATADLDVGTAGFLGFGINYTAGLVFAADPASTIHVSTACGNQAGDMGPDIPLVAGVGAMPAGFLTTNAHDYVIDFDGHVATFSIDGTVMATVTVKIPLASAQRYVVWLRNATNFPAPVAQTLLLIDRIDVASDERLVTTTAPGGGGGAPIVVNVDLQGQVESKQGLDPSSTRGALGDLALIEEPDGALRTRARVTTDERAFYDDFPGASLATPVVDNVTLALGSTAWSRAGTTITLKVGQYLYLNADGQAFGVQIATIDAGGLSGTLEAAYAGAGGTGAGSVSNWLQTIVTGGAAHTITVAGSSVLLTMAAAGVNLDMLMLARKIGAGNGKPFLPLRLMFAMAMSTRQANQNAFIGVFDSASIMTATQGAYCLFSGADRSEQVRITAFSDTGVQQQRTVTLPNGEHTDNASGFEIDVRPDQVSFFQHRNSLGEPLWVHLPDPYRPLYLIITIRNTNNIVNQTILSVDQIEVLPENVLQAKVEQTDPDKLQATAAVTALVQSAMTPNPLVVLGSTPTKLQLEPDGALRARTRAHTDEGSFGDDFRTSGGGGSGTGVDRTLAGTSLFTAGSTAVIGTGTAYTTAVRVGDYVQLDADGSLAAPVWAQVAEVIDSTHLTLATAYTGAGAAVPGAASVSNWILTVTDPAGAINCGATLVTLAAGGNAQTVALARRVSIPNRKDYAPVKIAAKLRVPNVNDPLQYLAWGFGDSGSGNVLASNWGASFVFMGNDRSQISIVAISVVGTFEFAIVQLPNGGRIDDGAGHRYEIHLYPDYARFLVDGVYVGELVTHTPLPYQSLFAVVSLYSAVAVVPGTSIDLDRVDLDNLDHLQVSSHQGQPAPVASAWPMALAAQGWSKLSPNPSGVSGSKALARLEPDGALRTRARTTTDEESLAANFPGASLFRVLTGGAVAIFTAGSTSVTSQNGAFLTEVRVGDYVELVADRNDAAPVLAQVASVDSDTHLTLRTAYTGAGGTNTAHVSDWYVHCTANAGDGLAVAGGAVGLTLGVVNGSRACLARRLGAGDRKAFLPLLARFMLSLSAIRANQQVMWGLASDFVPTTGVMAQTASFNSLAAATVNMNNYLDAVALIGNSKTVTLPDGGNITDATPHLFEVATVEDQVNWWINRYPMTNLNEIYNQGMVPTPYQDLWLFCYIANTGVPGGATTLTVYDAHVKSYNAIDVRATQPDADKLRASIVDRTPEGPTLGVPVTVDSDLVHTIAATIAGRRYRVSVVGSAGLCIRVDGVNAVNTDEPWWDGQKFSFTATVTSATGVTAIKRTAGTADGTVIVTPLV